jgi:hypothetical protein
MISFAAGVAAIVGWFAILSLENKPNVSHPADTITKIIAATFHHAVCLGAIGTTLAFCFSLPRAISISDKCFAVTAASEVHS